jgi:hypothetical protein
MKHFAVRRWSAPRFVVQLFGECDLKRDALHERRSFFLSIRSTPPQVPGSRGGCGKFSLQRAADTGSTCWADSAGRLGTGKQKGSYLVIFIWGRKRERLLFGSQEVIPATGRGTLPLRKRDYPRWLDPFLLVGRVNDYTLGKWGQREVGTVMRASFPMKGRECAESDGYYV